MRPGMRPERLRELVLAWYDENRRELPWRDSQEPYAIMVSEFMLQQTQVTTVIPYYQRFMARFPDIHRLARAELEEVLQVWQGLGYYRRAQQLHRAAQEIAMVYHGQFPSEPAQLRALPGFGPYTAAAVASMAFCQVVCCVDGNVIRVISRLADLEDDMDTSRGRRMVEQTCQLLLDPHRPGDFNQALMELGAEICRPRNPDCARCPWAQGCAVVQSGKAPETRPVRKKRKIPVLMEIHTLILVCGDRILLAQRDTASMLGGLFEAPGQSMSAHKPWELFFDAPLGLIGHLSAPVEHVYTHRRARHQVIVMRTDSPVSPRNLPQPYVSWRWPLREEISQIPTTGVFRKIWRAVRKEYIP